MRFRKRKIRANKKWLPRRAIRKANRKRPPSALERTVYAWFKEDGVKFSREKSIGICHADLFLEPRTIIELNGCYWHGCLICNKKLTPTQKLAQTKDGRRYAFFRNRGYDVVVVWECEVRQEPERVREQLRALYPQA